MNPFFSPKVCLTHAYIPPSSGYTMDICAQMTDTGVKNNAAIISQNINDEGPIAPDTDKYRTAKFAVIVINTISKKPNTFLSLTELIKAPLRFPIELGMTFEQI